MKKRKIVSVIAAVATAASALAGAVVQEIPVQAADKDYTYQADSSVNDRVWRKDGDHTWTMDLDDDGYSDVTLNSTVNDEGEEIWTYTFDVPDNSRDYQIYERMLQKGVDGKYIPYDNANLHLADGYTGKGSDGAKAADVEPGHVDQSAHTYTITNSKSHEPVETQKYGSLEITKKVDGVQVNPDQEFTFTIQLSDKNSEKKDTSTDDNKGSDTKNENPSSDKNEDDLSDKIRGSHIFGSTPFMNGRATISLKAGASQTITDIPEELSYTVTESPVNGYTKESSENDSGTIIANETQTVTFTNRSDYTPPDPATQKYVSFHLKNAVSGIPDSDDTEYQYHVLLSGLTPGKQYKYGKNGEKIYIADTDGKADVDVSLKKDELITFNDLEADTAKYQVMEEPGDFKESFTVEDANNMGLIARTKDQALKENTSLATSEETADDGEDITITFTNTFKAVQTLTVQNILSETINGKKASSDHNSADYKNLTDEEKAKIDEDAQKEYEFTVNFYNLPEDSEITSNVGKVTADEYGEAVKSFKLKGDGSKVVFENIPAGVKYRVTETGNPAKPSFDITTQNSRGKSIEGTVLTPKLTGSADSDLYTGQHDNGNDEDETLEENQSDTVTFVNVMPTWINLPVTGQKGIYGGVSAGCVSIGIGAFVLYRKKRKEN